MGSRLPAARCRSHRVRRQRLAGIRQRLRASATRTRKGRALRPALSTVVPRPSCGEASDRRLTQLRGGRNLHQATLVQNLRDLHRVGRGALEQVVADDPHLQAARVRRVAPQAADEDLVAAGRGERGRVAVGRRVVDQRSARACSRAARARPRRERSSRVSRLTDSECALRTGTRAQVTAILMLLVAEDLARLEHHLALFVGVVVAVGEVAGAAEHVERDVVRVDRRRPAAGRRRARRASGPRARARPSRRCRRPTGRSRRSGGRSRPPRGSA